MTTSIRIWHGTYPLSWVLGDTQIADEHNPQLLCCTHAVYFAVGGAARAVRRRGQSRAAFASHHADDVIRDTPRHRQHFVLRSGPFTRYISGLTVRSQVDRTKMTPKNGRARLVVDANVQRRKGYRVRMQLTT